MFFTIVLLVLKKEGEDHEYFFRYSPDAYSVGSDVLLYSMTH